MTHNFDQIAMRLKERYEEKNRKLKEVQGTFKEMLVTFQKEEQEKWNAEREEMAEQIAGLRQQLDEERKNAQGKVNDEQIQLIKEQAATREQKLIESIASLTRECNQLKEQLESLACSAES